MHTSIKLLATCVLMALAGAGAAAEFKLASHPQDSVPTQLTQQISKRTQSLESEPVQFAWRLDGAALTAVAAPYEAQSKEYWDRRSSEELAAGVAIPTTAPGAIVRLSPMGDASTKALEARSVILRKNGKTYANGAGMQAIADSAELAKGAAPFSAGTTVFRIDPALGAGQFELLVAQAQGDTVVHVFEPNSSSVLALKADRVSYQRGATIALTATLSDGQSSLKVNQISGLLTSPGGQVREIAFKADQAGQYRAQLPADFSAEASMGLYEIQTFVSASGAKGTLLRDARTAFAYSVPGARFTGAARTRALRMRDPYVSMEFDVEVAAASRYQIGGVLYGTDVNGNKVAVAMAQRAELLTPGLHSLVLHYGPDVLDGLNVGAPWEIRDLQLVDQADMGLQEQRVLGVAFDSAH
jgi:hypothetical protein